MAMLDEAYDLFDAGDLSRAADVCRAVLRDDAASFAALYLLGTILGEQQALPDAIAHLQQAVALRPDVKVARFNLAFVLLKSGASAAALAQVDAALRIDPLDLETLLLKAACHAGLADWDAAADACRRVLARDAGSARAHVTLAQALNGQGRSPEALLSLRTALALDPRAPDALRQRALVLKDAGRPDEALADLDRLVALDPEAPGAYFTRGVMRLDLKRFEEAAADFSRALALQPDHAEALSNRGLAYAELKRHDEALADFDRALALKPDYVEAWTNRGRSLALLARFDEALQDQNRALDLDPAYPHAWFNRGIVWSEKRGYDAARADYDQAIACKPDYAQAYWNKALLEIFLGRMDVGWPLYEWRLKMPEYAPACRHAQPRLPALAQAAGRTVLVHWEQGLGDTLQFCRYAPLLAAAGAHVLFAPQPALRALLAPLAGPRVTLVDFAAPGAPFDWQIPLLSLPQLFATTLETLPAVAPCLVAEPARVARWGARLGAEGFKIGVCWKGNPGFAGDAKRSFSLTEFAPLAQAPGVRLISLHKGAGEAELRQLAGAFRVETLGETFDAGPQAFLDTLAVMRSLDLVVTSDTSIAHLAGLAGVPVWVALCHAPDFRWMGAGADCPWYPTMRLFRQRSAGDWAGVFSDMAQALRRRAG